MPKITIDNREIEVPPDTKVIEAAERLGIIIPRFCYHPALGSVGACRVCAVAFKEGPVKGVQMSCMIDALDGMVVSTTDAEAVDFRRHVIEWLMLHHPHDCPVCDEGGHCLLQDLTIAGGHGMRRYQGRKRTHVDQDLGPLIQHEMNRCIQCYRCSRYYQEYAGGRDLGVMGIGHRVYFGRSAPGRLQSPFSGNLIDICPTGVYTDKPSRFFGRRWEFERAPSICVHCCLGCNLVVSARYRQVVRHEARPNAAVNGYFICDRGRYGYAYAGAEERPRQALSSGQAGAMDDLLIQAKAQLRQIAEHFGPQNVAAVASVRSSVETLAVLQQVCRENQWMEPAAALTPRCAENLTTAVTCLNPELAVSLSEVGAADTVLVLGADPINEAPMLALTLRQAQRRGGRVTVIDPRGVRMPLAFDHWAIPPLSLSASLAQLIRTISPDRAMPREQAPRQALASDRLQSLAKQLMSSKQVVVVCGTDIGTSREIALSADLVETLRREDIKAGLFYTLDGANAFSAGLLSNASLSVAQIIEQIEAGDVRALVIVENDLWRRFPDRHRLLAALDRLDLLIVMDHVVSPLNAKAHFFFPTQTLYEAGGHWVNQEGRLQPAQAAFGGGEPIAITGGLDHPPRVFDRRIPGGRPVAAWRVLANMAGHGGVTNAPDPDQYLAAALKGFHPALDDMETSQTGRRIRLEAIAAHQAPALLEAQDEPADALTLLLVDWTFGTEPLSAQTPALSQVEREPAAGMHPRDIERLGLENSQAIAVTSEKGRITMPLKSDKGMAPGVVVIPRHHRLDWHIFAETRFAIDRGQITKL